MTLSQYIEKLNTRYKAGISTEHSYRGDLQSLLETLTPDLLVTNEPSRVACGAPDYILTKKNIPVGYIEAKDIGADLDNKTYNEQFSRYKASLHNLIITNYLDFRLYRDGVFVTSISIATVINCKIARIPAKYEQFEALIKDFSTYAGQTIRSAEKLARMMAGKARMLANVIENALLSDVSQPGNVVYEAENTSLQEQLTAFRQVLIHDIDPKEFADIYAQTIAYGMFAARLHDPSLEDFSRQEAAELIPKSNPFLRKLFQYVAGYDLDNRIKWIVDALADIFRATNVAELMKDFGKSTQQNDPVIHFYETFLGEYDPKLRKSRGVYYTPEPVVNFIVRAVDDILKTEFDLKDGLADISKTKVKVKIPTHDYRMKVDGQKGYTEVEQEVHKVQILDPAAGTGTFLAEVIKQIYKKFEGQQGIWSQYVEDHLIPRLNGFEILMASYAMAHLKLDLLLAETGYKPKKDQRLRVYLTNSLEEYHPDTGTLFAGWLSSEANEANFIKRDTPVMVVLGNPPYSVSSSNKSAWIEKLTADYKKNLNERNIQPLSDDYIKFIRFGQHFIEKNGEGILAFISNNGFIDGIIHRQMRRHLLEKFGKIYILDLHGNAKKKETAPDGSPDQNVFDIMQGVSISILINKGNKKTNEFAKTLHYDLYGKREDKYDFLNNQSISSIQWTDLEVKEPGLFFVPKNLEDEKSYLTGFNISTLFVKNISGIKTHDDDNLVSFEKYQEHNQAYNYRPFDVRNVNYNLKKVVRHRYSVMKHFLKTNNIGLIATRMNRQISLGYFYVTKKIMDLHILDNARDSTFLFPLYFYSEISETTFTENPERYPNLNMGIVGQIAENIGFVFTNEKEQTPDTFAPIDILDYIYAVLHSPTYREKYKEFLKIDFPRVPYPKDATTFWLLVAMGSELRQIHLLESPVVEKFITTYPQSGSNAVDKVRYEAGKVWINDQQYFNGVPLVAWEFYIGGYQPAQKWLKDRKERVLSYDDLRHYQKIIVALTETDRLMKEIEKIDIE